MTNQPFIMSRSLRFSLILLGLLLICGSLALVIYLNWPGEVESLHATLEPTLFIRP